jgi:hypothetical protein
MLVSWSELLALAEQGEDASLRLAVAGQLCGAGLRRYAPFDCLRTSPGVTHDMLAETEGTSKAPDCVLTTEDARRMRSAAARAWGFELGRCARVHIEDLGPSPAAR